MRKAFLNTIFSEGQVSTLVAGIVCEYNPFHKGHRYHIDKTRQAGASHIVCVMSGNFVQRGECAVTDKWQRAAVAVGQGADLVIDLPVPWALGSAESFARGAIALLAAVGIDVLSFGSELEDKELLRRCARATEDSECISSLKKYMTKGLSYPAALTRAVREHYGEDCGRVLSLPNSTLAVEYIKALELYAPRADILPVSRIGAAHDSDTGEQGFASASSIRGSINNEGTEQWLPRESYRALRESLDSLTAPCTLDNAQRSVLSSLRELKKEDYALYVSSQSGLCERLSKAVLSATSLEELYMGAKSKSVTLSRVRREVMNLYLRIPKALAQTEPTYIRVLAGSRRGLELLKNAALPVVTRHSQAVFEDELSQSIYSLQCSSTDKFALMSPLVRPMGLEQRNSVIILDR